MAAVRQRKKYKTPKKPFDREVLREEIRLVGIYGLRNKRELWRAKTMISTIRKNARELLSKGGEESEKLKEQLLSRLHRLGLLPENATLDEVLELKVEDLLERRLQTLVFRKGLAVSPQHARQLITHGHIAIAGRRIRSPGYLVSKDEENMIEIWHSSPLKKK